MNDYSDSGSGKAVSRRRFVSSLGLLGAAGLLPAPVRALAPLPEEGAILKTGPYLQAPDTDRVTIRWITRLPCYSWVEFGDSAAKLDRKAQTVSNGMVEANNTVHAITLKNLTPGRQYHYRICSKVIESFEPYKLVYGDTFTSDIYSFKTIDPGARTASFVVFNDIHDRPASFAHLMQYQGEGEKDFVFLNGDMFDLQTDENQLVDHLLQPLSELFARRTPFVFSRGNHETRGKFSRQLAQYFDGGEEKYYYSFQRGPVYCIVLDSGEDKADNAPAYAGIVDFDAYRQQQAAWLEKEVQKKAFRKAKYKVVFSHIPLFHSGDWHGTMHCRQVWNPILNKAKIDMLISGHTHKYGIHPPEKGQHDYPIVIGGGPQAGRRTLIRVAADQESLRLEMLDDSGKVVGTLQV
ncbi:MAG: metallophosphoesterase [Adhaeribacter sp.]